MDVAERMKIRRKSIARDAGLEDSYDVGPAYPSEGPQIVNVSHGGGGLLKGAALAAGLLLGGGGASLGVAAMLGAFVDRPAAVVPATPAPVEWEITVESVDGEPVITKATPVD